MIRVVIDTREPDRASLRASLTEYGLDHEERSLPTGDLWVEHVDGRILACFERKTLPDFWASIVDRRYHAQRSEMASLGAPTWGYLVTGRWNTLSETHMRAILTCILKLQCVYHAKVFHLPSDASIAYFLKKWVEEFRSGRLEAPNDLHVTAASAHGVLERRKRIRESNIYAKQLACIPGVGPHVIQAIQRHYPSLRSLLTGLDTLGDTCISNLVLSNNRRVGPKVGSRIYESFK